MASLSHLVILLGILICFVSVVKANRCEVKDMTSKKWKRFIAKRNLRNLQSKNEEAMIRLSNMIEYGAFRTNYLQELLRTRVPDTRSHHKAKRFIIKKLESFGWQVKLDKFVGATPIGYKTFTNIVATLNPNTKRRLALVAHYDSKFLSSKNGKEFIGATDSAVSCAMLLDVAKLLTDKSKKDKNRTAEVSPMLIFTDGEEAFVRWSKDDSLYGSRHLAQTFGNWTHNDEYFGNGSVSLMDTLDAFILLDLIGTKHTKFYDMYPKTSNLFQHLKKIERSLSNTGKITKQASYFRRQWNVRVQDDHIPFLERGIPTLHLISLPYPSVWHSVSDDESALDKDTIIDLLKIFRQFLVEYFQLD